MMQELTHLTLIFDSLAPSFCHYAATNSGNYNLMPFELFVQAISFAKQHNLSVNVVKSDHQIPESYRAVLKSVDHVLIEPLSANSSQNFSIKIVELDKLEENIDLIEYCKDSIVVVRLSVKQIDRLYKVVESLSKLALRVNIVFTDISDFETRDIPFYSKQLGEIGNLIAGDAVTQGELDKEINILTDRLFLTEMNNCNAGINNITIAPNGKFYICPGFYYQDSANNIGDITGKVDIKNQHLLTLHKSPICFQCDSYQCKRCVFLNKQLTGETNVPSEQQCQISHIERNASATLLKALQKGNIVKELNTIPPVEYLDPFELIVKN
jgi:CXXX repeat peptide maturase